MYLTLCLQRWLNLILDLMAAGMAIFVIAAAVFFPGNMTGGGMGVALNIVIIVNFTLLKLVNAWASLELSLGGVARLKALTSAIPREDSPWDSLVSNAWRPSGGAIELRHVTAAYR